jgi:hypothetical protein
VVALRCSSLPTPSRQTAQRTSTTVDAGDAAEGRRQVSWFTAGRSLHVSASLDVEQADGEVADACLDGINVLSFLETMLAGVGLLVGTPP